MKRLWHVRELSTVVILLLEIMFFGWYLWPDGDRSHPFLNAENALLILKYSSIYGIAAVGAAIVIISGGIDLAPGSIIALASVVCGVLFVDAGWGLGPGRADVAAGRHRRRRAQLGPDRRRSSCRRSSPRSASWASRAASRSSSPRGGTSISRARCRADGGPLGFPADWVAPIIMILLAVVFQILMTRFQWGRQIFAIGGNETAALFSGVAVGRLKTSVYLLSGLLAAVAGVVLALVQGQGKADLATGYELDIIASAVVGGASLSGGRGSVMGAVLGTLIFGVLRNALPQIPGATFYDRLIVGLAVIVIVVMDQLLLKRGE